MRRVPFGRMGKPDELVGAALYLASEASSMVTRPHPRRWTAARSRPDSRAMRGVAAPSSIRQQMLAHALPTHGVQRLTLVVTWMAAPVESATRPPRVIPRYRGKSQWHATCCAFRACARPVSPTFTPGRFSRRIVAVSTFREATHGDEDVRSRRTALGVAGMLAGADLRRSVTVVVRRLEVPGCDGRWSQGSQPCSSGLSPSWSGCARRPPRRSPPGRPRETGPTRRPFEPRDRLTHRPSDS